MAPFRLPGFHPHPGGRAPHRGFAALPPRVSTDLGTKLRPRLEAIRRQSNFEEVVGGLSGSEALFEARRCLSCGSCLGCDNCFGVCPDNAVIKLQDEGGPGAYLIDPDYCKGCGLCAQECPCGAIAMVDETI